MVLVELGCVVSIGTEVRLEVVAVEIRPADTSVVGHVGALARGSSDAHLGVVDGVGQVAEVGLVARQGRRPSGDGIGGGLLEGHTGHQVEVVLLRYGEVVVGEVLPLIIEVGGSASADGEGLVLGRVHEQLIVV